MAKTSRTVPKKDRASSSSASRPAKPVVPPTLEEITPGNCIIKKDFSIENPPDVAGRCEHVSRYISLITEKLTKDAKGLEFTLSHPVRLYRPQLFRGLIKLQRRTTKSFFASTDETKDQGWMSRFVRLMLGRPQWCPTSRIGSESLGDASEMRPASPGEKTKPSNPKSEKDNKRKRVSKLGDPQDKKTPARRLRKRFAQTGADSVHDSPDDRENDNEESALVTRTRKPLEVAKPSETETSSCGEDVPKEETGKAPVSPEVEIIPPPSITIPEGVNAETPNDNENSPSEELGPATTTTYFEGAIEEANAMRMPDPNKAIEDDFQGCYIGIEDANDFNDASSIFEEAQRLLSRAELSQCETELQKVSGEEKALRLLCSQKEEEFKDLRTALAKAQKASPS
ncbi:PREDICTED: uncharacterized protein LOC109209240 [Nicotiana attenuata]|uniref:uncharacterized protein LOC109209240 n=1 Tax=Nicotiana attenuata TaxID=49451 RepID=UPI00090489BD|nr:PREDICTED: uncharacterized protein LOC109209240 [Nicotiana attenuata]